MKTLFIINKQSGQQTKIGNLHRIKTKQPENRNE